MAVKPLNHYSIESPGTVYDEEAMTALELAGRTAEKVNECVKEVNNIPEKIAVDVNEHIKNGDFDEQIDEHTVELTKHLNETDKHVTNEISRMATELQGIEDDLGGRVDRLLANLNTGGDATSEIVDARNGHVTLGDYLRDSFITLPVGGDYVTGDFDMNTHFDPGTYVISSNQLVNGPAGWNEGVTLVKVEGFGVKLSATGHQQHGMQILTNNAITKGRIRKFVYGQDGVLTFDEWKPIGMEDIVITDVTKSVDKVVEDGHYLFAGNGFADAPVSSGFTLDVKNMYDWPTQFLMPIPAYETVLYFRAGRVVGVGDGNFSDSTNVSWMPWKRAATLDEVEATLGEVSSTQSNAGYKIVNFGDSIFGAEQGATSVSNYLATATGADVVNAGFGGCHMSTHWGADWTPFSMWKIADAIATGDFTEQHTKASAGVSGMPSYFANAVDRLESTDFSKVDLVTIGYGTNDFTTGDAVDGNDKYDVTTFGGALRYSIERLLNAYPNLRIALVAPCWRCWLDDSNNYVEDSDTKKFSSEHLLHDFVDKMLEIGKEYHLPVVNPYDNLSINKFNYAQWTYDGTHPTELGRKQLAKLIANTVRGM